MRVLLLAAGFIVALAGAARADFETALAAYKAGDYAAALQEWHALATRGDIESQNKLGQLYNDGDGVPQDFVESAKWYQLAADQGGGHAQLVIGGLYEKGKGVPQNLVQAHMWYNLAGANLSRIEAELAATYREAAAKGRTRVAENLTPDQVAEAQGLARAWWDRHRKAAEEARRLAEAEARREAEEELRRLVEAEAQRGAEEELRRLVEAEAGRQAEEEARREAEEEVRRLAKAEAQRQAEEEARRLAKAEAQHQAEEEARRLAEAEAQRQAEEEAHRLAEAEAQHQAEEEARRLAEVEARRLAAEEVLRKAAARRKAEEEAQLQAETEVQREAEAEAQRLAEAEAQRLAEAEAQRQAEEEERRQAKAEAAARPQIAVLDQVLFTESFTNVRARPDKTSNKLTTVTNDTGLQVTGKTADGRWYRVRLSDGTDGFVWASLLVPQRPQTASRSEASVQPAPAQDAKTTQAALNAPEDNAAKIRRQIDEMKRYLDQYPRQAQTAFKKLVARGKVVAFDDRFLHVIAFKDVVFEDSEYKVTVLFMYCHIDYGCRKRSEQAPFTARFQGGKLTFLRKTSRTAKSASKPGQDYDFKFGEDVGAD